MEHDREFCCHQITHLLDVARIAYIKNLEAGLGIDKELIYTAAILHDIGKALQYTDKIPHEIAGEKIAGEILDTLSENDAFSETERAWYQKLCADIAENVTACRRWQDYFMSVTSVPEIVLRVR